MIVELGEIGDVLDIDGTCIVEIRGLVERVVDGFVRSIKGLLEECKVVVVHEAGLIEVPVAPRAESVQVRIGLGCVGVEEAVVAGIAYAIIVGVEL